MHFLQKIYIFLLSPVGKLTARLSNRIKTAVLFACCVAINVYFMAFHSIPGRDFFVLDLNRSHVIACLILLIMICFSINGNLRIVRWNRFLFYSFMITGIGMFFISFLHTVGDGYRAFSLIFLIGFPCLYFVWNNRSDYDTLFCLISSSTAITGLIYFVYCIRLSLLGELVGEAGRRATGNMQNANLFCMIGMVMVSCGAYLLLATNKKIAWLILSVMSIGAGVSIVLMGGSRTSMIVIIGTAFCLIVYYYKYNYYHQNLEKPLKRIGIALVTIMIILSFIALGEQMMSVNRIIHKAMAEREQKESIQVSEALEISKQTENDEKSSTMTEGSFGRFKTSEDASINKYSSGRIRIWEGYARHLNLLGNDFCSTDWNELTGTPVRHAHNNFLEYGYRFGVPIALMHCAIELYVGIIALMFLFSRKYKEPCYFFVIVNVMMYACESLVEVATLPFERLAPFFFYLAITPVFAFIRNKEHLAEVNKEKNNSADK